MASAAYDLFSHQGIRGVTMDEVVERAKVAKATLYKYFPTKNDLVLSLLKAREQRWTYGIVASEARQRGATPKERLLAIFDAFADWFHSPTFDGCTFINVLLGSIVAAAEGDRPAAQRVKAMARWLIEQHRPKPVRDEHQLRHRPTRGGR